MKPSNELAPRSFGGQCLSSRTRKMLQKCFNFTVSGTSIEHADDRRGSSSIVNAFSTKSITSGQHELFTEEALNLRAPAFKSLLRVP